MSPGARALVLLLVLLPAAALALLGLQALRADAAEARRDATDAARGIRDRLRDDLLAHLREHQRSVEAGTRDPGGFRVEASGRIALPLARSFSASPRSFAPGDLVAIRGFLERADRAIFAEDPESAVALLEPAAGVFEDEDLAAVLRDRTALAHERAGGTELAILLYRKNLERHPGARDLDGFPLAIPAALGWARTLRTAERDAEARLVERRLAVLLAENPWNLREETRALLRRDLPYVPEETLYAAVRAVVVPEVDRLAAAGGWRTLRARAAGRGVLVTLRGASEGGVEGAVVSEDEFRARLEDRAAELRVTGAVVSVDGDAPLPADAEIVEGPLAAPFEGLSVRIGVRPRERGPTLLLLWAGLCVFLLVSLTAGVTLGIRALRREIRLARLRQDLLDNVSHELRTPLASIRTLAENLEDGTVPEARRAEYFAALHRESRRVARLVEDVLDLSKHDRGAAAPGLEPVDVADLARGAVEDLADEPGAEGFRVGVDLADDLPVVRGDREALRRALGNLLFNAARHAGEPGEADLVVREDGGTVLLAVRDRGPGIPPADRRAVFDRFHRVPSATHEVKGTGLGLPLARAIVEAHGGRIRLESKVGRGSTFTIELPAEEVA